MAFRVFCAQCALSTVLFALLALHPALPSTPLHLSLEIQLHLVSASKLLDLLQILIIANIAIGSLLHVQLGSYKRPARLILLPYLYLPLAFMGFFWIGFLPPPIESNLLFWIPIVCITFSTFHLFQSIAKIDSRRFKILCALLLMLAGTIWYSLSGVVISRRFGEHGVDEGHYIIQVESLYQDRDLNIRDNLGFDIDTEIARRMAADQRHGTLGQDELRKLITAEIRAGQHIRPDSPAENWRSWHPWGISLLLAPSYPFGLGARYMSLALISMAGFLLVFMLCASINIKTSAAFLICLLTALSSYWTVYSIRVLPEVLGATLFVAAMAAPYIYRRMRLAGVLLLAAACIYMPIAHPRFAPCALIAIAFFLHQLLSERIERRSVAICLLLSMIGSILAAISVMAFFPDFISRITSYSLESNFFMVYPEGIWLILFSERGIFFSFPLATAFVTATVYAIIHDRENTSLHITALTVFVFYAVFWGSVDCWDGGPTLPGRYLLIGVPLMIPAAAYTYSRISATGKTWMIFLGICSIFPFVLNLLSLDAVPRDFMRILIPCIKWIIPHFRNLLVPYHFTDINIGKPYHGIAALMATPFSLSLLIATAIIVFSRRRRIQYSAMITLLAIYIYISVANNVADKPYPRWIANKIAQFPVANAIVVNGAGDVPGLKTISNLFAGFVERRLGPIGADAPEDGISPPGLEEAGEYAWAALTDDFLPGMPGPRLLWLKYRLDDNAQARIVVCQADKTILSRDLATTSGLEKTLNLELETTDPQPIRILIGIPKGDGAIDLNELGWSPLPLDASY